MKLGNGNLLIPMNLDFVFFFLRQLQEEEEENINRIKINVYQTVGFYQ